MSDAVRRTTNPYDRVSGLADWALDGFRACPEYEGESDKAIVMILGPERAVIALANYTDDADAMADLVMHLRAFFRANGKEFDSTTIDSVVGGAPRNR